MHLNKPAEERQGSQDSNRTFISTLGFHQLLQTDMVCVPTNIDDGELPKDDCCFVCEPRSEVTGTVEAIQTSKNILYGRKAVGHLLVLPNKLKLNHGLMELGYVDHQVAKSNNTPLSSKSDEDENGASSISMTTTLNTKGNLVLGSSREFKGFSREVDKLILKCIWDRAGEFFPEECSS